ncbi:mite allergen Eur m 3-like [Schistocerca americana]|uniref:mite allergen Eur m 3-like n=1 Tax=Schistocerca americana TaxID=7009 RepID=UPI001F4FDE74|nr:mite allergen Eur m 3-like [Schistocerca americana]
MQSVTWLVLLLVTAAHSTAGGVSPPALSEVSGRIINGEPAALGEFPAQLSLQKNGHHSCGASILSDYWALTAAHCVYALVSGTVLELLSGTITLDEGGTRHSVTSIVIHPQYDESDSWVNDVAVLRVWMPFPLNSETVAPIQLPEQGEDTPAGSPVTVVGWGRLSFDGNISNSLQKVDIEVWDRDLCSLLFEDGFQSPVYLTQICAAGVDERGSSCDVSTAPIQFQGDSGGTLLLEGVVVGLVSWSYRCATPPYPTVYTRVSSYVDWIGQQISVGRTAPGLH